MTSISISDVGPVIEFEYDLAEHGLHILKGQQGAGKTTILRTVQLAVDGRTDIKPTKRDGDAARNLRNAAGDTQAVLSDAIARIKDCPLRVQFDDAGDARLVVKTDRDDAEPFDELSDGERWPFMRGKEPPHCAATGRIRRTVARNPASAA